MSSTRSSLLPRAKRRPERTDSFSPATTPDGYDPIGSGFKIPCLKLKRAARNGIHGARLWITATAPSQLVGVTCQCLLGVRPLLPRTPAARKRAPHRQGDNTLRLQIRALAEGQKTAARARRPRLPTQTCRLHTPGDTRSPP